MGRLDTDRQKELEPKRIEGSIRVLKELGYVILNQDDKKVQFIHHGSTITLFPYSGWFTGKGIKDGRGFKKLIKQLK